MSKATHVPIYSPAGRRVHGFKGEMAMENGQIKMNYFIRGQITN